MKILFNGYSELAEQKGKKLYGGPQVFTKQLVNFLRENGHEFVGLIPKSNRAFADYYEVKTIPAKGGKWLQFTTAFHVLDILRSKRADILKYTQRPIKVLSEVIAKEKPNVVLLNGFSMTNWYMLQAARKAKIPVVVSHHGLWFKEISEFAKNVTKMATRITFEMEKDVKRYAKHQFFLNKFSMRVYEKNFGVVNNKKKSILPITVNPVYLKVLKKKRRSGPLRIGFVGRWNPIKRPEVVLEIAKQVKKQKLNWKFYAVTKIFPVKQLENIAKDFEKHFKVIPNLEPDKLKEFYADMDLLILPSRFDVSPTVVAEAALQGKGTIISPNVGWVDEYLDSGITKWIDPFSNPKKTIERIKMLAIRPFPENFVKYIKKQHDVKKVMQEQLVILKKVSKR